MLTGIVGNPITTSQVGKYGDLGALEPKLIVQGDIKTVNSDGNVDGTVETKKMRAGVLSGATDFGSAWSGFQYDSTNLMFRHATGNQGFGVNTSGKLYAYKKGGTGWEITK